MSCFVKVQGIKTLVQQFYSNGPPTNLEFTVVLAAEDDGDDLMKKAGKIKRISPEEPVALGFISYWNTFPAVQQVQLVGTLIWLCKV